MDELFVLIGKDAQGALSGPIGKHKFTDYDTACEHAKTVLSSNGNMNLVEVCIMQCVSIAQRVTPPVEIIPVLRKPMVNKAA